MKPKASPAGFTWVEVLVVIGIVGMLAVILLPNFGKALDDAKKSRAREDCEAIAQALEKFHRDTGVWPTLGSTGMPNEICALVTGASVVTTAPYGFTTTNANTRLWLTGGTNNNAMTDLLSNHLLANSPAGQTTYTYPTTATAPYCWKGPYFQKTAMDPWGHPYVVTVQAPDAYRVSDANGDVYSYSRWVVSAGPNGIIDTVWQPTSSTGFRRSNLGGDDIGSRIDAELDY